VGANTKTLRTRIKSVDSTLHLTKAMGLVASSKIRRAGEAMHKSRQYKDALGSVVKNLTGSRECQKSPFMQSRGDALSRTRIIVIAGDRGMAGGYNANIMRLAAQYKGADIIPIGKRACEKFPNGAYGREFYSSERFSSDMAAELMKKQCADFAAGEYDRLGIISTEYVSMMTQTAKIDWVLPLTKAEAEDTGAGSMLFEPDEISVLNAVVPEYAAGVLMGCIRESFAAEVTARRMAMDSAGKNATAMIDDLTLKYNRARQGAITQEITEIVAGAGAQ